MIPDFRDVGETVNILSGEEIMEANVLFRGGTINELFDASELPKVRTILNLRTGKDRHFALNSVQIRNLHIPAVDSVEKPLL